MIFYFSATGNTLWAARRIGEATGESLVPMTDGDMPVCLQLAPGERIGFCFPVHGWRPPLVVRRFVQRLKCAPQLHPYTFAVCTAGDTVGEAMRIFRHDLEKTGLPLCAAASLLMPESYVGLPFMDVDTPHREQAKIQAAGERLSRLVIPRILRNERFGQPLDTGRWPRINSRILGAAFVCCLVTDRPFRVQPSRCIQCGRCAAVCPVDNIEWNKGQVPRWRHNGRCLSCFACYHHCPQRAISYGWRTMGKGQYYFGHAPNAR